MVIVKTRPAPIRTLKENSYLHGVVVPAVATRLKMEPDVAKEFIKLIFNIKSTASLTTQEFEQFTENVRTHFKKYYDLEIPLPQ